MALADKTYLRIYEDGGSGTDALTNDEQLEFKRQFEANEYIVDENFREAFGVILYAIQSLSEDIDEIRRYADPTTGNQTGDLGKIMDAVGFDGAGDIELSGGTTIPLSQIANIATDKILGRTTANSGDIEEISPANLLTMIGVEPSADVTDTANVTAAGALMDTELTDLAGVKGVTISTLQVKPIEGAFANGDKTRLDGMEDNATADQTQAEINSLNITAASCTGNAATATALESGNQTINGDLTVTSGAAGDARLIISSDTNDNPAHETYNPQLWFKQDGDINAGAVQLINNKLQIISNESVLGGISFLTGTTNNTSATDPSTGATEKMAISPAGVVSIHGVAEVGTRDGDDYLQIARYSSASPYALISCGEPGNVNTNVGLKVTRKNGSGANVDCLTIEGSNGDTTISGALTATNGITNAGTIAAGTWNGAVIASSYLDSDTAHLGGAQTFMGAKTFAALITADGGITSGFPITAESSVIMQGNRSVIASTDGRVMHVDAMDITDTTTTASGTSTAYNHVSIENPRLLASNALVTTTDASTLQIKGAPVASTNQTITNAWALKVTAGNCKFGGDLDVTGNVLPGITYVKILPSDFIPDDAGRPIMIDDTGSDRWLESHGTAKMFASVQIPAGFKATHVDIYGDDTSQVTVYEADIDSKHVTSRGTGNIGTQINITDVIADATNYILIQLAQASGEKVYGGKLTIAKA
jgi:hypothetical protein